jgi:hypothetical protein
MDDGNRAFAALNALAVGRKAIEREWKARMTALRHGDSKTAQNYTETADRWEKKAEAAFATVEDYLKSRTC